MKLRITLSLLLGLLYAAHLSAAENHFESPTAGVSLTKPDSWVFASAQAVQENRERVRLSDAEFEQRLRTQANLPLVVATKHPEPYPDVNPSFQIGFRPLGGLEGKTPIELLSVVLPSLRSAFQDFEMVAPVSSTAVGGLPAARAGFRYTLKTADAGAFPIRSELIVVPRGKFMFLIGMGRKPDDSEAESEQEAILASVQIQP